MLIAIIVIVGLTAAAAVAIVGHREGALAPSTAAHGTSPIDEAERILARRYAVGEISAEEFERMLIILRR